MQKDKNEEANPVLLYRSSTMYEGHPIVREPELWIAVVLGVFFLVRWCWNS